MMTREARHVARYMASVRLDVVIRTLLCNSVIENSRIGCIGAEVDEPMRRHAQAIAAVGVS